MNISEITKQVRSEFSKKQLVAENKAKENLQKAKQNQNFDKLCTEEKNISFELAKATANNADQKQTSKLEKQLEKIRTEKTKILKSLGLSENDLKPVCDCKICGDTGTAFGKMCECFKKRRNEIFIKEFGLKQNEFKDFSSIDYSLCKDETQKANLKKLADLLENWCNKFPDVKKNNIVLFGATGVGKTYLAKCVAKKMSDNGNLVCFLSAFEMNNIMLSYHTTFSAEKQDVLVPLLESDILVVDDLGTEPLIKNVTINYLFLILSERERMGKPTIITTNLLQNNIAQLYGERIFSRIFNKLSSVAFKLDGNDLRAK